MSDNKSRNETSAADIAAFTKATNGPIGLRPELTDEERNDELFPKPLVRIVN